MKRLVITAYENNILDRRVLLLITRLVEEFALTDFDLYHTHSKLWQQVLENAFSVMPREDIENIVETVIKKIKGGYSHYWGEKYLKLLYFVIPKHKDILFKVSLEIIPDANDELMAKIGLKMEKIDTELAVKQYLLWIHTHITKSYTYYVHAANFLQRVKKILLATNNIKEWTKIRNEIINKYSTRKKFIEKIKDII